MTANPPAGDLPADASKEQIQEDIDATRDRLAASVEELAAKADVKAQVGSAAQQARDNAQAKVHQAGKTLTAETQGLIGTYRHLPRTAQVALLLLPAAIMMLFIIRAIRH